MKCIWKAPLIKIPLSILLAGIGFWVAIVLIIPIGNVIYQHINLNIVSFAIAGAIAFSIPGILLRIADWELNRGILLWTILTGGILTPLLVYVAVILGFSSGFGETASRLIFSLLFGVPFITLGVLVGKPKINYLNGLGIAVVIALLGAFSYSILNNVDSIGIIIGLLVGTTIGIKNYMWRKRTTA